MPTNAGDPTSPVGRALDWAFRSRQSGRIVVGQWPNLALGLFFATVVLRRLVDDDGRWHTVLGWASAATLGWWALDEVLRGVNPWRLLLGVGGCVLVLLQVLALLG